MNGADRYFVDSNVILYTYDTKNAAKRERAEAWLEWLWEETACCLSWQVLQEFYWNAVQKLRAEPRKVREHIVLLAQLKPPEVTLGLLERAWFWTDQARLAFWDAMIVATAERTHCRWLLSEDFQSGRRFGSVTVLNPFESEPGGSPAAS
ncbi:MAG TPA: PIN domain-containing protein [Bryobacteraceae bacterium]|nr:PIN domain-containing protein [Bryobacteraceae bacterium]